MKEAPHDLKSLCLVCQYYSYRQILSYIMERNVDVTDVMIHINKQTDKLAKKLEKDGFDTKKFEKLLKGKKKK